MPVSICVISVHVQRGAKKTPSAFLSVGFDCFDKPPISTNTEH